MTDICGGGASGPKAGVAETVIFGSGALASVLNNKGGGWATIAAPLLGVLSYQATELCDTDPPEAPTIEPEEWTALLKLSDPAASVGTLAKLADLAKIAIWYTLCECTAVNTPPIPPATFTPPEGIDTRGTGQGCFTAEGSADFDPTNGFTPWLPRWRWDNIPPLEQRRYALPPNVTSLVINVRNYSPVGDPSASNLAVVVRWYDAPDNVSTSTTAVALLAPNGETTVTVSSPITSPWGIALEASHTVGDSNQTVSGGVTAYCGDQVPGQLNSCDCPPDATIVALLNNILTTVTLIQRQHVPFAYVPGLDYTGLSGNGEVTFSDPITRLRVELTTIPPWLASIDAFPDRIFDVGWLALGTADGFEPTQRITHTPFMLQVPGDVTKIGYSFGTGVEATIQTYSREP